MATVESTSNGTQLRYPGGRRIDRQASTGYLFYLSYGGGTSIQIYRSVDNGASWATFGAVRTAVATIDEMGSLFVDWQNRLYFTYRSNVSSQDRVYMQAAVITPTGPSWHTPLLVASAANGGVSGAALSGTALTVVRHTDGRTTGAVGVAFNGASIGLNLYGFTIPAAGQPVLNNNVIANRRTWTATGSATGHSVPAMGYESSPAHMWVSFGRTYIYAVKCTWNGAGWTAPTTAVRITPGTIGVSATPAAMESVAALWRNPGWVTAQPTPEDATTILLSERNQGNAYTTYKVSLTHPTGVIRNCAVSLNNQTHDVRIYAVGTSTAVLYYCDYLAASGTFTSWATVVATAISTVDNYSVRRENYQSSNFDVLTESGSSNPWTITHTAQKATYAPFVPTWNETAMARPSGSAADVGSSLLLQWNFSDPDPGDSQTAWALSRVIGAGSTQYFRASDSTWQTTEQKNTGVTTNRTLAAAWGVDGDAPHTYQVKVWDITDVASNYSAGYSVLPSAKANPSISLSEIIDINPSLDTGFETSVAGFVGVNGTLTQSSTFAHTGTKSAKLVTAAATTPKITRTANDPVTVGQQYTFDAWLYVPSSLGANQAFVALDWMNGTSLVSSSTTTLTMPVGVWTNVSVTASAPGGTTGVRRTAGVSGAAPAGLELYLDDAMVLSPWSGTVHTDTIVASWFVTEMSAYRVTLSTNPGGVQVYDSGWLASTNDFTHLIPYRVPDGTTWTVGLQTRNNEGLTSNLVTAGFFVDYAEPPTPTCTLAPLPDSGIIRVAIANPAPTVAQPAVSSQTLYRRPRLYSNQLPNPGFETATGGSGWLALDGSGARSTTQAHTGSWSFFVTPNGTGLFPRADGSYVPLTGIMRAGGWIRAEAGTSVLQIAVHAFDAAGGYITTRAQRRTTAALGQWVYLDTTADFGDLPTAALCTVALGRGDGITAPAAGDTFYVDDAWVSPADPFTGDVVVSGVLDRIGSQGATAADTFSRTVSSAWGTPDISGGSWTATGTAADFSVDGSVGKMSLGVVNDPHRMVVSVTPAILALEDFEDASFVTPMSGTWARSTVRAQAGTWSLKAAVTPHSGNSDMVVTLPVGTTSVSFYYWVSSEAGFDFFKVIGNGNVLFLDSGVDTAWNFVKVAVPAGVTSLTFQYIKDSGGLGGEDTAFIDQLTFLDETGGKDVDISATITCPVAPAGAAIVVGLLARYIDTNNYYLGEMLLNAASTVTARIRKSVTGTLSTISTSSAIAGLVPTAGKTYRLRFACQGSSLRVRVWDAAVTEPTGVWHLDLTDTALNPATSQVGIRSALDVGNTNTLPVVLSFDTFLVTGSIGGGSIASTVDDWQVAAGIDYEYRVLAQAANGTSAYGPWTS